jgi:WD40 repeat protein/nucleoside phosphorylase
MPAIDRNPPYDRARLQNVFQKILPGLSPGMRKLAESLLDKVEDDGSANVGALHEHLFPAAPSSKSASAQLSKVLKAIGEAAENAGIALETGYTGSKQAGATERRLVFRGPGPGLREDAEGLNAIPPEQLLLGQTGALLVGEATVVLMTFNAHEFAAVRRQFWSQNGEPPTQQRDGIDVDDLGMHGGLRVLHRHSGQGNRAAQRTASDLIAAYRPQAIVAVGIAFGVSEDKQSIGDVLVSRFLCDYELARVGPGQVGIRGPRPPAARVLLDALNMLDQRQKTSPEQGTWPTLHFGGLLTGEKLVDSLDYRESLKGLADQDDIVGGEMEAAGLFTACDGKGVDWLVVKAICDWADGHKTKDKKRRQQHAAANAALVVKALIDQGGLYPAVPPAPTFGDGKPRCRLDLEKQQRLLEGHDHRHIIAGQFGIETDLGRLAAAKKRESTDAEENTGFIVFDDLLAWARDPQGKPLYALLGDYGMGKTITSQRLAKHLRERRATGEAWPLPLYFDLRKVERLLAIGPDAPGKVPTLRETIEDCLRHGYLQTEGEPTYADVQAAIDLGALVIFDGLDEVLSRIGEQQGLRFTANLLKIIPEAEARQAKGKAAPPKVLISCRTQFFRNLAEQNAHFTGEHRGARPADHYRAVELQGFRDEQIVAYLQAIFPEIDPQVLLAQIESVHNLRELAARPFTLKLVAEFIPQIDAWRAAGRRVTGATLYREVARQWLIRDKEKQSFQPEDKELLAADLAAYFWQQGKRGLTARELETWLGNWLAEQKRRDPGARFHAKPRELLEEDLRNSTFLKRSDGGKPADSRFEFAHTSLYEFFLADHLRRALRDASLPDEEARVRWVGPRVSDETLDFLGQMLAEENSSTSLERLACWRTPYLAQASELVLAYALRAYRKGWPCPSLAGIVLQGADLTEWSFGSENEEPEPNRPRFDLRRADLRGARLRRSHFWGVDLEDSRLDDAILTQAEFLDCRLSGVQWKNAELGGALLRHCRLDDTVSSHLTATRLIDCLGGPPSHQAASHSRLGLATGHNYLVVACAFSRGGHGVVSASMNATLRLWDVDSSECLRIFPRTESATQPCVFSHDGQQFLSSSADGILRLRDTISGECLRVYAGHEGAITSCAFSPDNRLLLSGSTDKTLRLWDAATGECLRVFTGHEGAATSCAFSPDSHRILSSSAYKTLRLWDADSGQCLSVFSSPNGLVTAIVFSPDGERFLSASNDKKLRLWDAKSGECLRIFTGHEERLTSCAFSQDGHHVLSASADSTLRLWDTSSGTCLRIFTGHDSWVMFCTISKDGCRVLSASADSTLRLWDTDSGECLSVFSGPDGSAETSAFSPDGRCLLSISSDKTIRLWDTESGQCLRVIADHKKYVTSSVFSPDGNYLLSASTDKSLRLWDTESGKCLRVYVGHEGSVWSCAFSADGQNLLSTSADQSLRLWDTGSGKCLRVFSGHEGYVRSCAFSPDGRHLLSCSNDDTLRLWEADSGKCLRIFSGHTGSVASCTFSPDGCHVLSASMDGTLRLWDATTGECLRVFSGHEHMVDSCAFSPDGRHIVSSSYDQTLRIWDTDSGECLRICAGHEGAVLFSAFSPDGRYLLSTSYDNTMRLWNAASGECLRIYLHIPGGHAAWDPQTNRLLHATGRAWRYLGWFGEENGKPKVWPLELGPPELMPPAA